VHVGLESIIRAPKVHHGVFAPRGGAHAPTEGTCAISRPRRVARADQQVGIVEEALGGQVVGELGEREPLERERFHTRLVPRPQQRHQGGAGGGVRRHGRQEGRLERRARLVLGRQLRERERRQLDPLEETDRWHRG